MRHTARIRYMVSWPSPSGVALVVGSRNEGKRNGTNAEKRNNRATQKRRIDGIAKVSGISGRTVSRIESVRSVIEFDAGDVNFWRVVIFY